MTVDSNVFDIGISCLIPNRNGQSFIPSLENYFSSVSWSNLEILIVDDNSTDSSMDNFRAWASRDNRVRVVSSPGNGLVEALNFGISIANHDWIARFDVDDQYSVDRLSLQAQAIDSTTVLIFSDYELVDSYGNYMGVIPGPGIHEEALLALHSNRRTPHSSALFLKQAAVSVGSYSKDEFLAEDQGLWIRLSRIGKIKSISTPLLRYRISHTSLLAKNRIAATEARDIVRAQMDFLTIARNTSKNISKVRQRSQALSCPEERFLFVIFETAEIFTKKRKIKDLLVLIFRVIPLLRLGQIPALIRISNLRSLKNKLLQPD